MGNENDKADKPDKSLFDRVHDAIDRNMDHGSTNKDVKNKAERDQLDRLDKEQKDGTTP